MFQFKISCGLALGLAVLANPALAQTATAFNLTCTPQSHQFEGANTFGAPLTFADYQGVAEETVDLAMDLTAKAHCNPKYCTPAQWADADRIISISAREILLDDIAPREVPSNDYNVMGYRSAYDPVSKVLTISYVFLDEAQKTRTGAFTLLKSCTKSPFALSKE